LKVWGCNFKLKALRSLPAKGGVGTGTECSAARSFERSFLDEIESLVTSLKCDFLP
jgi:hypothetical protein